MKRSAMVMDRQHVRSLSPRFQSRTTTGGQLDSDHRGAVHVNRSRVTVAVPSLVRLPRSFLLLGLGVVWLVVGVLPHDAAAQPSPPSCAGLGAICGDGSDDCCETILIPSSSYTMALGDGDPDECNCTNCDSSCSACGTYGCNANESPGVPTTVSAFYLDRFEVNVARFRNWVEAGAPVPSAGDGVHSHLPGGQLFGESGWDVAWSVSDNFDRDLFCATGTSAWNASNDQLPMNCVNWFEAFAFCVWDGGFLPTDAEWELAASGAEERLFPWSAPPSSDVINDTTAAYGCVGPGCYFPPGTYPDGRGRWGHDDLGGNIREWVLDWSDQGFVAPCEDCYRGMPTFSRSQRGGDWGTQAVELRAVRRTGAGPTARSPQVGFRCARPGPDTTTTGTLEGVVRFDLGSAQIAAGGIEVFADLDSDGMPGPDEPRTTTNEPNPVIPFSGGDYQLVGVPVGAADLHIINPVPDTLHVVAPAAGSYPVTIEAGTTQTNLDFVLAAIPAGAVVEGRVWIEAGGISVPGTGLTVFADVNGNEVMDIDEPSTITEDNNPLFPFSGGDYRLANLPAGLTRIRVVNPMPAEAVLVSPETGYHELMLAEGAAVTDVNFAFGVLPPPGVVTGEVAVQIGDAIRGADGVTVYADLNANGAFDSGEPTAVTAEPHPALPFGGGSYRLTDLPAGDLEIRLVNPDPDTLEILTPSDAHHVVTVSDGAEVGDINFVLGIRPSGAVVEGFVGVVVGETGQPADGVTIYADLNENGVLDADEPSDETSQPTIGFPFSGGQYRLEGLAAGEVQIRLVNPAPDDIIIQRPAEEFHTLSLELGDVVSGIDFALAARPGPAVIEGEVWVLLDGAGLPVDGVTVFVDLNDNGALDPEEPMAVSSEPAPLFPFSGGDYRIEGIPAGTVTIRVINPDPESVTLRIPEAGSYTMSVADGDLRQDVNFGFATIGSSSMEMPEDTCGFVPGGPSSSSPIALGVLALLLLTRRRRRRL